ncbi:MAG: SPASM domain-containing protein [Acidobacteriota bacterium]|nr:SPASM domain-containing protein [Acidobacteriota bacterium]
MHSLFFWDGFVLPCPQDFFCHYLLGNAKDSSLMEIWNSELNTSVF